MTLEKAKPEDRETINRISCQVHDLHVQLRPDIFERTQERYAPEVYREALEAGELYCVRQDGQVVGYARLIQYVRGGMGSVKRSILEIEELGVDEMYRRQGIGSLMMEEIRTLAKHLGVTDLQLSVYSQNTAARAFYEKCGFLPRCIQMQRKV